ncbi:NAD(P)H-hydrate epimerase [Peptoclostridium litorale DSM 5388]|uniref:Bifunctional NAD(P)H-hydrate repair enzyme n=1 Tax=Peptoclostridium litorale DSM 5388 TaxID=1121324 RepID=A0A069RPD4_PEPLI|nr:bifunctional ADP-dependent NAD(P)H-hydrate dehydratase/NAD(P)H-hydrate epimerase [Peptoclostridium litorale]KDR96037.1 bifunctional NAD(P)H-hydrate repair enzyme Nnr [Peptoclostridium litorale DSM 5388]SIO06110.1 NAD(P)H-hydrate epimerase [Peptoclostridium litorale DSM 5388]
MEKVLFSFEMKSTDAKAIREYSIPGMVLMENAGRKTFEIIQRRFPCKDKKMLVACGIGNNGGDGYVVARHLSNNGYDVVVSVAGKKEDIRGDALLNLEIIEKMGIKVAYAYTGDDFKDFMNENSFEVIVDAIFGIGIDRPVEGKMKDVIECINEYEPKEYVFSVDLPSGINADTGFVMGCAVNADETVTFASYKPAHIINDGIYHSGKTEVVDISIPKAILNDFDRNILDKEHICKMFKKRKGNSHKGTYGKIGIAAGSRNMPGAALLCSKAAMRSGSGIVNLYVDYNTFAAVSGKNAEVITVESDFSDANFMLESLEKMDAILVGPGLSQASERKALVEKLVKSQVPMVIDADGLNVLKGNLEIIRKKDIIITPHIGEMARLLGTDTKYVIENCISVARKFASDYGVTVVLKGTATIIASPGEQTYVCCDPNPGMATAGSGDVLSGIIVSMLGQGYSLSESAMLGVYIHSIAGRFALEEFGEYSLLAPDIIDMISKSIKYILQGK